MPPLEHSDRTCFPGTDHRLNGQRDGPFSEVGWLAGLSQFGVHMEPLAAGVPAQDADGRRLHNALQSAAPLAYPGLADDRRKTRR